MSVERIDYGNETLAIVVRKEYQPSKKIDFITSDDCPLQFGILTHERGSVIKPHIHINRERVITQTVEILHVEMGKIEVDIYTPDGNKVIKTVKLGCGDTIIFVNCGHGIRILEDSRILEVKQGPYYGVENDKIRIGD